MALQVKKRVLRKRPVTCCLIVIGEEINTGCDLEKEIVARVYLPAFGEVELLTEGPAVAAQVDGLILVIIAGGQEEIRGKGKIGFRCGVVDKPEGPQQDNVADTRGLAVQSACVVN